MNGPEFDQLLTTAFRRWGFAVAEKRGADAPIDYVLRRGKETFLVHCKEMLAKSVCVPPVQAFYEAMSALGAAGGYVLTTGAFTSDADAFARERNIILLDGARLSDMLRKARGGPGRGEPNCPQCGRRMVKRLGKQGTYAGQVIWGCSRFPECRGLLTADEAQSAPDEAQLEQRALEALKAKFRDGVEIRKLQSLPFPLFDFDPSGWLLFCVERGSSEAAADQYVAVHPPSGKVRLLAPPRAAR